MNAKLFAFEKSNQSWLEKGRGLLRLNDMSENGESAFQSRLGETSFSLKSLLILANKTPFVTEMIYLGLFKFFVSHEDTGQLESSFEHEVMAGHDSGASQSEKCSNHGSGFR